MLLKSQPCQRDIDSCSSQEDTVSFIKLKLRRCNLSSSPSPPPLSLSMSPLTNKQCSLLNAWGTRDRFPSSVRQIAGEMDVSVSQRCLISVRCSVYFRLFRGLLASKPHVAHFIFFFQVSNLSGESRTELILLSCFPAVHRTVWVFFFTVLLRHWPACQFTIQHLSKYIDK